MPTTSNTSTKKRKRDEATAPAPKNTLHSFFSKQKSAPAKTSVPAPAATQNDSNASSRPKKRLKIMNHAKNSAEATQDEDIIPFDDNASNLPTFTSDEAFLRNSSDVNGSFKGTTFFSSLHSKAKSQQNATLQKYDLWAEKYRPTSMPDLIGNQVKVDKLGDWLRNWHGKWLGKKKVEASASSRKKKAPPKMKASDYQDKSVLIYGKPGIGKTTAARLVAQSLGFEVLEMNASDTRSKNSLKDQVAQLVDNQTMYRFCTNLAEGGEATKKRQCLIMDEVDGMSSGDRGGIAELLKIIRTSKIPIICIANDGRDQKLKSLRAYSMDMQFDTPPEQVIFNKMKKLCETENLKITDQALRNIIKSLDGDIRAIVTNLQFLSKRQTKERSQAIMQSEQDVTKDSQIPNIFSLADSILRYNQNLPPNWASMPIPKKAEYLKSAPRPLKQFTDYYFYDTMFIPMLIEQNYINMQPYLIAKIPEPQQTDQRFRRIYSAAESISYSDLVDVRIRRDQAWEVAPLHAVTSTIFPSLFVRGTYQRVMPYDAPTIKFPTILGKASAARKNQAEIDDLSASISTSGNASGVDLLLDGYAQILDQKFGTLLKSEDGIDEALQLMQEYNLSRSDLDLLAKHAQQFVPSGAPTFSSVNPNTKRALTKAYKEQIGGESVGRVAKTARGKALDEMSDEDDGTESEEDQEFKPVITKKKASPKGKKKSSKK